MAMPPVPPLKVYIKRKKMKKPAKTEDEDESPRKKTISASTLSTVPAASSSFFRILLPELNFFNQLRLPLSFGGRFLKGKTGDHQIRATLVNPKGKSWRVDIYKDSDSIRYFGGEAWRDLVKSHRLGAGFLLLFDFKGDLIFDFRVYDLSTSEVNNYPSDGFTTCNVGDVKLKERMMIRKEAIKGSTVALSSRAFEAVISSSFLRSYLNVPQACKQVVQLSRGGIGTLAALVDPKGRMWPVRLRSKGSTARLSKGWLQFARRYKLNVRDRCVFVLDHSELGYPKILLNVQIFKRDRD
ncbi:B3 domain-containing protein REM5 [Apostasia shenzhenica]|uniref:B3 domain-containing protein REM5 n=1 Tax=Apostasia shenzhenica TaxID=1088818 RepID=A0A2I0AJA1_9ASPA|nr:B3 domain-containing protein REM5 [Apostasia shenzhenica]